MRAKCARARKKLLGRITRNDKNRSLHAVTTETKFASGKALPPDLMDGFVSLSFEGREYMCMAQWDAFLTAKFGDYMTPPPESERTWTHHPIVLDFDHDYEERMTVRNAQRPTDAESD